MRICKMRLTLLQEKREYNQEILEKRKKKTEECDCGFSMKDDKN